MTYKNQTVKVDDPQGRFMDGHEFKNVTAFYNKGKKEWSLKIPEIKPVEPDKPKPKSLYSDKDTGIGVIKRVDGKIQWSWQITEEKFLSMGFKKLAAAVKSTITIVWDKVLHPDDV